MSEQEEVVMAKRECENKGSVEDCAWWVEQGYCTKEDFMPAMMEQCPCSCGSSNAVCAAGVCAF